MHSGGVTKSDDCFQMKKGINFIKTIQDKKQASNFCQARANRKLKYELSL